MTLTVLTHDRLTTVVIEIVLPVGKLLLMFCSKQAVSCHVCFNSVVSTPGNRRCSLAMSSIFVMFKFKRAYLKFPVSGQSKLSLVPARVGSGDETNIDRRNEATLVWGSLMLAPINL